jgi:hypothetical protein
MFDYLKDHEHFHREFVDVPPHAGITVGFNWNWFLLTKPAIDSVEVTTTADLGKFFLPWYTVPGGGQVHIEDPNAKPLQLSNLQASFTSLWIDTQRGVHDRIRRMQSYVEPTCFPAPVYSSQGRTELIILDRCKRISALMLANVPFRVTFLKIIGQFDPSCLPDLLRYS